MIIRHNDTVKPRVRILVITGQFMFASDQVTRRSRGSNVFWRCLGCVMWTAFNYFLYMLRTCVNWHGTQPRSNRWTDSGSETKRTRLTKSNKHFSKQLWILRAKQAQNTRWNFCIFAKCGLLTWIKKKLGQLLLWPTDRVMRNNKVNTVNYMVCPWQSLHDCFQ